MLCQMDFSIENRQQTKNFWADLPRPFFVLAPMEAVTDIVFRHVVAQAARPDVYFTEFTNAHSFASPAGIHSTRGRLEFRADEQPMVAQIWGNRPDHFEAMSCGLRDMGFAGIDINTGCPDKSVVKNGCGSSLIRDVDLTSRLITAAQAGGLPVSVKTRLGYNSTSEMTDWLSHLLRHNLPNLSVHLRTRKEMSKVPAHFELIPDILKLRDQIAPQTRITINGDIRDHIHGRELFDQYGIDGVMIGRGIFSNPFAFETAAREHSRNELLSLLQRHLDLFDQYNTEVTPRRYEPLKRFFKIYIRNFEGASELRDQLMHTKSTTEARATLFTLK